MFFRYSTFGVEMVTRTVSSLVQYNIQIYMRPPLTWKMTYKLATHAPRPRLIRQAQRGHNTTWYYINYIMSLYIVIVRRITVNITYTSQGVNSLVVFDQPAGDRQSYGTSSTTTDCIVNGFGYNNTYNTNVSAWYTNDTLTHVVII